MLPPWWEDDAYPGLLDFELERLEQAGFAPRLDREARDTDGIIRVSLTVPVDGLDEPLGLVATYPDTYPFFRPEVQAPTLQLDRHQHPFAQTLCLLARGSEFWDVEMSLAELISDQLPELLKAVELAGTPEAHPLEEPAGEPFSEYYDYVRGAAIVVDGQADIPAAEHHGELLVGYLDDPAGRVRGAVLEVRGASGNLVWEADDSLRRLYASTARGRWVRLDGPIRAGNVEEFTAELTERHTDLRRAGRDTVTLHSPARTDWDLVGVIFPDETTYQGQGDSWVFLARATSRSKGKGKISFGDHGLVRAWRAGRDDMSIRTPSLTPLRDKTVAMIGTGALGAPLALEFAKAGARRLRLMDPDLLDPATSSRWPAGVRSAGLPKLEWLHATIATEYPYTEVEPIGWRLGAPRLPGTYVPPEREILERFVGGADLIVDASADLGVQYAVSTLARRNGIDYLCLEATAGAWGGVVARVPAAAEGCWGCFQAELAERGLPPSDPAGEIRPPGCSEATFTGTSFDLLPVTMMAARMAVATLCRSHPDAYPDVGWDVTTVALRDAEGRPVLPVWDGFTLSRHAGCATPSLHQ